MRCTEIGLTQTDLEHMDMGLIYDIMTEKVNDVYYEGNKKDETTQDFFDNFAKG